jgi:diacylglycerol kinase (ATP)
MDLPYPRIHVVINPAAGGDKPILNTLNDVFQPAGVEWQISLTKKPGDATRQARQAAEEGADLVAACGGDGTQMEVANGLYGTGVPQAILPCGTGNAMAHELQVPLNLRQAAEMLVSSHKRRAIDLARVGDQVFMLRAYAGISSQDVARREEKDRYGQLAYIQASLRVFQNIKDIQYRARIDGEVIQGEALVCFVLNAGSIGGVMGIDIPPVGDVDVSDGYLDFYVVTRGVQPLRAISHYIFHQDESEGGVYTWRGKEIELETEPVQDVWIDGEPGGKTPCKIITLHQALEIAVPGPTALSPSIDIL